MSSTYVGRCRPTVMWFRRDLRLADHPALAAAADAGAVVPVVVIDPHLSGRSTRRDAAYAAAVGSLASSIAEHGGELVIRHGSPAQEIASLASEVGARRVVVTDDFGPYGRRRDREVGASLASMEAELVGVGSPYAVPPGTITKADSTPYAVFTPFFRRWTEHLNRADAQQPSGERRSGTGRSDVRSAVDASDIEWCAAPSDTAAIEAHDVPTSADDVLTTLGLEMSEAAAWTRWEMFRSGADEGGVANYDTERDLPAIDGTSLMSPYLKYGIVHPHQLLAELDTSQPGPAAYVRELAFRDFYADVTFHYPDSTWRNLNRRYDAIRVDDGPDAVERFGLWCTGRTGFPIVDAGMRQLNATGWMHNRVRMIVASFLVKDLHLPWQWGATYFMEQLVDGDSASNSQGWQWAAGSGTDAAPYFRVFNPTTQFERWDPTAIYVRRWLPEWGTDDYPEQMVDHAAERAEALDRFAQI